MPYPAIKISKCSELNSWKHFSGSAKIWSRQYYRLTLWHELLRKEFPENRMWIFWLQLEASCLQWSFLLTVDNFSFVTYSWSFLLTVLAFIQESPRQTKETAKTKSSWISPIFLWILVFFLRKTSTIHTSSFCSGMPPEKFMNWPFFGLVCRGHSWVVLTVGAFFFAYSGKERLIRALTLIFFSLPFGKTRKNPQKQPGFVLAGEPLKSLEKKHKTLKQARISFRALFKG